MATTSSSNYWTATAEHVTPMTPHNQEEENTKQHMFGLCPGCKVGLDNRGDYTYNYVGNPKGTIMCHKCDDKLRGKNVFCMYCRAYTDTKVLCGCEIREWNGWLSKKTALCCRQCISTQT